MTHLCSQAQQLVDELHQDTQSGATQLAVDTLRRLETYVSRHQPDPDLLARLLEELAGARPSMVVIGNAMARIQAQLDAGSGNAGHVIGGIRQALEAAGDSITREARSLIPDGATVMTHSASSSVMALLRTKAQNADRFSVICTQSSPGMEGHTVAQTLDALKVPVTVITDAQMGLFVPKADLIVTGCDCWLADRHFVNKSGTLPLALAAHYYGKPFWVLADSFRDSDKTRDTVSLEEISPQEMAVPEGEFITARNVYFEAIPEALVSGRVSEQGVSWFPAAPRP